MRFLRRKERIERIERLSIVNMEENVIRFIKGQDFLRLGQAISHHQWQAAAMTVRRMEQQVKKPGLEGFARPLAGIRQAIMRKDEREAKQIMANITARRVQLLEQLRCERETQEAAERSEETQRKTEK